MKNSFSKIFILISLAAVSAFPAPAQKAKSADSVEGEWTVTFDSPKVHFPALMEFVRKNSKILAYATPPDDVEIYFSEIDYQQNSLRIKGNATYNKVNVPISLTADISGDALKGKLNVPFIGEITLQGLRIPRAFSSVSRVKVFDEVCNLVEKNFYKPNYNGLDWDSTKKIYREKVIASQSYSEMTLLVREMLGKLKASHIAFYPVLPSIGESAKTAAEKNVEWKKINEKIGYLKIKEFADETNQSGKLIDKAFSELGNLPALIVDLRDNPGGGLEVALPLAKHLFQGEQCVGYFYDRRRAAKMKSDSLEELKRQNFPVYSETILPGKSEASKLIIKGTGDKFYRGKVVVLIDAEDYSTTEALAAAFKESGRGILVGEKTSGQMLAAGSFPIGKFWRLNLPVADFRTCGGVKVEGSGVTPDVAVEETNSTDTALVKAIDILK